MNELDIAKTIMFVREVCKAKDGDTKMIFGKPFEMKGGKWVPSSGGGKKEEAPKKSTGSTVESEAKKRFTEMKNEYRKLQRYAEEGQLSHSEQKRMRDLKQRMREEEQRQY